MSLSPDRAVLIGIFVVLSLVKLGKHISKRRFPFDSYLDYTWVFFLSFVVAEMSLAASIWILALVCFWALREYFSLLDIRLQDRVGILGAYLSIPFMIHFIQIDWYGMFIISIPVYSFLAIPLLVTLGGRETRGTVFSIGAIDFGLFLFVYCMGHIGYLLRFSTWKAAMLIVTVAVCDAIACGVHAKIKSFWPNVLARYFIPLPFTIMIALLLIPWTGIPTKHSLVLAFMIPMLVIMGHRTSNYVESDLGIQEDTMSPGRGQILDNLKSLFFAAPITFHYIRYYVT